MSQITSGKGKAGKFATRPCLPKPSLQAFQPGREPPAAIDISCFKTHKFRLKKLKKYKNY
jgi:hypothetical protein